MTARCRLPTYWYVRIATTHYSLAFTYDWIASERERRHYTCFIPDELEDWQRPLMWKVAQAMKQETGIDWPSSRRRNRVF